MSRLIDADELRAGWLEWNPYEIIEANTVLESIDEQPTVDPVVHGRWIFGTTLNHDWMKCSECLKSQTPTLVFSYCPNCGAKLDKEED